MLERYDYVEWFRTIGFIFKRQFRGAFIFYLLKETVRWDLLA